VINSYRGKNILIKTYLSESGLFYLAKSLGDALSVNNNVYYVSKSKYVNKGVGVGAFKRIYPQSNDPTLLDGMQAFTLSDNRSIYGQILEIVKDKEIDEIISFETFMRKAQWVSQVKNACDVSVVGVPMPEWVSENFVRNDSYKIFDKILCLTDTSFEIFGSYDNKVRTSWDYVDRSLFDLTLSKKSEDNLLFYHQASLNPGFSQKNTTQVIEAFLVFDKINPDVSRLTVSGKLSKEEMVLAEKSKNIILITDVIERREIADIYSRAHCVICPSTREGLGLSFFEAKSMGCGIITTDVDPMNTHTDYLCEVISYNNSESMVPHAVTSAQRIFEQINIFYKDFKMSKNIEIKKKTKKQIEEENNALMSAFDGTEGQGEGPDLKEETLDTLREKMKEKKKVKKKEEEEEVIDVVSRRDVSIELAVIGVGQAGSRIAETMHKKGYDVGVINTSAQDLEFIEVLPHQKLLVEGSLGGTGKDLDYGRGLFEESIDMIVPFVEEVVEGNNMVYLAISGGGGTGSSSVDTLVPMLFETGLPVGVIYVLPKATEDAQSKKNSIETLSRLARLTADNLVSSLVVVDNARIEQIYANLSQTKFWETSNNAIVEPLHLFNSLTAKASRFTSLDPSDFGKIISCGDCSTYGVMEVEDYMEETALAEAVIDSLSSNMLAEGFDISQARVGGVIITGSKETLEKIPSININYCFHMISEQTNGASIFQGVYDVESDSDSVKIYSWFAGLGLPKDRVESLKRESKQQSIVASEKEKNRGSAMTLDLEEDQVSTVASQINRKIQKKKSGFSRLQKGGGKGRASIIDRRKKRR
jgi:cell division GTPase FtsZ/glycosyltransferase involved in cell wall biosynthesis